MKKILGLDIGTNSIGWTLVSEAETNQIIDLGVRVLSDPKSTVHSREFEEGKGISKNEARRKKRGMRRNGQRYKLRRKKLIDLLTSHNMLPTSNLQFELNSLELYGLRAKAANGTQVLLSELGKIILHLNQKRGFKSNRKANIEEKEQEVSEKENTKSKKKGLVETLNDNEALLKKDGLTIGQFFYKALLTDKIHKIKQVNFSRKAYVAEFDLIWEKQATFCPHILTNELKKAIKDEILYFQRPLKSQKHLVSECRFEKGHKVVAKSSPLFQAFRIWQQVNNLKLINVRERSQGAFDYLGERNLTDEEKNNVFIYLDNVEKSDTKSVIKKVLNLNPNDGFTMNYDALEGNVTKARIAKAFEKANITEAKLLYFDPFSLEQKGNYFHLWHLLYSIESPENLANALQKNFGFSIEQAETVAKVNLSNDYGSLSARAIRRLLPELASGFTYDKACENAAAISNNANYAAHKITKSERLENSLDDFIKTVLPSELRNPVVEGIVNQVISLVNQIVADDKYVTKEERQNNQFEIRIELARELKSNIKQRDKMTKTIKENKTKNINYAKAIIEAGISNPTGRDIEKYKLWEMQGKCSPYTMQPMSPIPLAKLFDDNYYQVDHIIPRSRFFDDSLANKVVVETKENAQKSSKLAREYMEEKDKLGAYEQWVNQNKNTLGRRKTELLLAKEVPKEFLTRQLKETQYITKEVVKRLGAVCHSVVVTTGGVTDYLRHQWGLNEVLQQLNIDKYRKANRVLNISDKKGVHKDVIMDWSKREDHRHHAIDAVVIALTKQSYIQQLNNLSQVIENNQERKEKGRKIAAPIDNITEYVKGKVAEILISHKQNKKVFSTKKNSINIKGVVKTQVTGVPRGPLHEESIYGRIKWYYWQELNSAFSDYESISDPFAKELVMARLAQNDWDCKKAFHRNYKKDPIYLDEAQAKPLLKVQMFRYVKKYTLDINFDAKKVPDIVDKKAREKVRERLEMFNNEHKIAFKNLEENPIWLDDACTIAIKSVRLFVAPGKMRALRKDKEGKAIDFVASGSNHHLAIYENEEGRFSEIVPFWVAVERKKQGSALIDKTPKDGSRFVGSYQINDMYVFDLDPKEIDFNDPKNAALISKYLYRVQKLSKKNTGSIDIVFRHHLATQLKDTAVEKEIREFINVQSLGGLTGIKVIVNKLGKIVKVGE